jgi:H+/Cl- antiporter ClcA
VYNKKCFIGGIMTNSIKDILKRKHNYKIAMVIEGTIVGILVSLVVVCYRLSLRFASEQLLNILAFCKQSAFTIILWFIILAILAYIVSILINIEPLISGSGIPQLEAELSGHVRSKSIRTILLKFIGGFISLFAGLSLGREGPSIQLGAMVGKTLNKFLKRDKAEEKLLLTCGASAGLAAAFHAPLAGVMFAIEEVHKHFTIALLIAVMSSSIAADFVMARILGMKPVFSFDIVAVMPENNYLIVVVLGIALGILGALYNASLLKAQDLYAKLPNNFTRLLIPFMLAGIIGFTYPILLGGGDLIIEGLSLHELSTLTLCLLLFAKFFFAIMSYSSGAPGGIFFPLLVLGSLLGNIIANLGVSHFGLDPIFINNIIILAMAGLFSSIVRAPLTGIILLFEMTGSLTNLLSISLVAIISYVVAELFKSQPIYESLLDKFVLTQTDNVIVKNSHEKVLLEFSVSNNSYLDDKKIKDIYWPDDCLLVSIIRGGTEITPNGNTIILDGDLITTICDLSNESETYNTILMMCEDMNNI